MTSNTIWREHHLTKDELTLVLLPGIGGRLMDILFQGQSLLFRNPDIESVTPDLANLQELPSRAAHFPFPLWGGEKTWVAPDSSWSNGAPHPELDSGVYTLESISASSARMTSRVCTDSRLQVTRTISFSDIKPDSWKVQHSIKNCGTETRYCGIWSVMMLCHPVRILYPQQPLDIVKPLFGNAGGCIDRGENFTSVSCEKHQEFKIGAQPSTAQAVTVIPNSNGQLFLTSSLPELAEPEAYAHGQALEVFNSGHYDYAELEWHSPAVSLLPEQSIDMTIDYAISDEPKAVYREFTASEVH